jgi:hypothetical protein
MLVPRSDAMSNVLRRCVAMALVVCVSGCAMVSPQLKPDVRVAGTWNEAGPANAAAVSRTWCPRSEIRVRSR